MRRTRADDVVKIKGVSIAREDGNAVLIGSGLAIGEKVALNLSNQVRDGEKVKISEMIDARKPTNLAESTP
jgi:hypothetical protein